jgi:hypothetical protein
MNSCNLDKIKGVTLKLLDYCRANDWAGYDPYDALNSKFFKYVPFLDSRFPRLVLTQLLKRSPINLRPLLMIPKTQNPKAIALFLTAFLKLERMELLKDKGLISLMVQKLIELRSPTHLNNSGSLINPSNSMNSNNLYWNWGYSFPWQTRTILVHRGAPNLVCTTFVANALLDLYETGLRASSKAVFKPPTSSEAVSSGEVYLQPQTSNVFDPSSSNEAVLKPSTSYALCLEMATSSADYILNELYWAKGDSAGFSYPLPSFQTQVHNANFLAAALFCRIYKHNGEKKYLEPALKVARYSVRLQHLDGSWAYGEHKTQRWVDNFHTGYNLGALRTICRYLDTNEFEPHIRKGFEFYKNHFFREDGAPKYFHNKTFPIDIHSVAQGIVTLMEFQDLDQGNLELAYRVFRWAMTNMWEIHEHFCYQVTPYNKNKISYMRWSQAWMLLALAVLLEAENG